jgi:hypothetical protein
MPGTHGLENWPRTNDHLRLDVHTLLFGINPLSVFALGALLLVVLDVVYPQGTLQDLRAVQIVDGKHSRALIFVHHECKALGFASILVTRHVDVHDLAIPIHP